MLKRTLGLAAVCLTLAACGGGGGGGAAPGGGITTPLPPAPVTPVPNASFSDLRLNQSFSAITALATAAFDLTAGRTISGTAAASTLTVSYDVAAARYTLAAPGRTAEFGPAELVTSDALDAIYDRSGGGSHDILTLFKAPWTGGVTQYVQLGFWQRNVLTPGRQDTHFDTFVFGFPTSATAVPRSGNASFRVTAFGLATHPGVEPATFDGDGLLSADFLSGVYSLHVPLTETGLISGASTTGGLIELTGGGRLSATDGALSGNILYSSSRGYMGGLMSGRLYGPGAEEVGGSFSGVATASVFNLAAPLGSAFNGALFGRRATDGPAVNLTLTNLIAPQAFYTKGFDLYIIPDGSAGPGAIQVRTTPMDSQLNRQTTGTFTFGPGTSLYPTLTYSASTQVTSPNANFVAHRTSSNGHDVNLSLYKPGPANTELALTYATFGHWSSATPYGVGLETDKVFFAYGLATPPRLLSARAGSGTYAGVIYGAAANQTTKATYDVTGSSSFNVNFTAQTYTGVLTMQGAPTNGASPINFGSYDFSGNMGFQDESSAAISRGGSVVGELRTSFYGPDGEEIAGPFTVRAPVGAPGAGTAIVGVTAAKRQ